MNFSKVNRAIHRDVGYLLVGFTLLYAVTGVLLNHLHDWNPIYAISGSKAFVGALTGSDDASVAKEAMRRLNIPGEPLSSYRPDEQTLDVFLEGGDRLSVNTVTGEVLVERVSRRTLTARMNDLHLNRPRAPWTYVADAYSVLLAVLAISGAMIMFQKRPVSRRGAVLTAVGLISAVASLLFTR